MVLQPRFPHRISISNTYHPDTSTFNTHHLPLTLKTHQTESPKQSTLIRHLNTYTQPLPLTLNTHQTPHHSTITTHTQHSPDTSTLNTYHLHSPDTSTLTWQANISGPRPNPSIANCSSGSMSWGRDNSKGPIALWDSLTWSLLCSSTLSTDFRYTIKFSFSLKWKHQERSNLWFSCHLMSSSRRVGDGGGVLGLPGSGMKWLLCIIQSLCHGSLFIFQVWHLFV